MTDLLHIADDFTLPPEAVTQTIAILAKRGVGKTYTAAVLTEEMLAAGLHVVVLDPVGVWWGLRSSADGEGEGLPIVVLGGDHADLPLSPQAGAVVADFVVDTGQSAVLDVSDFTQGEQARFMTAFAEQLYQRKARERAPLHLVLDEADAFIPQVPMPDERRMLGAMDRIVRRGRARGLGITLISQRPAVINKNVLTQTEVLITLQMTGPQDQKAIETWVSANGTEAQKKELMGSLASLPVGTAWVWSPSWLKVFQQIHVRARRTYDSSATPKVGDAVREPKVLAPVDLQALKERMAASVEEAQANDPAALKAKIADLKKHLEQRQPERVEVPVEVVKEVEKIVEVAVLSPEQMREFGDMVTALRADAKDLMRMADMIDHRLVLAQIKSSSGPAPNQPFPIFVGEGKQEGGEAKPAPTKAVEAVSAPKQAVVPPPSKTTPPIQGEADPRLRSGEKRILTALARCHRATLTPAQLGTLSKLTPSGGTWNEYIGRLKMEGMLVQESGAFRITQAGLAALGKGVPPEPMTTAEVIEMWRPALKAKEVQMLELLVERHPLGLKPQNIAERLGLTHGAGTFNGYLGTLKQNGLVAVGNGAVFASDVLFPKGVGE